LFPDILNDVLEKDLYTQL
jgi:hypothetical protein